MFELVQVAENTYYISNPSKIGVYRLSDTDVCLIDSGISKDTGKRILKVINAQGWRIRCIINTHSHADHIGGNAYLQEQTGCDVFSKGFEAVYIENTFLEPTTLFGAFPCSDLRHKFLMAQPSVVKNISDSDLPSQLKIVDLPGHAFDMIGVLTPDGVLFAGDTVISQATIDKYKVFYLFDVKTHIQTLESLKQFDAKVFVPSHTEPVEDITELVDFNLKSLLEIKDIILEKLQVPTAFDELIKYLFDKFELKLTFEQYALIGSTVKSYLSWLKDEGIVNVSFDDNMMRWYTV